MRAKLNNIFILISIVFAILISLFCCSTRNSEYPRVEIPNIIEIGSVKISKNKRDSFNIVIPIKNTSNDILQIMNVQTSCECVLSKRENSTLKIYPQERSVINLVFKPTKLENGYIERTIFVYFRGYKVPYLITITADITHNNSIK